MNQLPVPWKVAIAEQLSPLAKSQIQSLWEKSVGLATTYPPKAEVFAAFEATPLEQVKVVIIGQDPYHGEGQAHGLAFSVRHGLKYPPSLRNLLKELAQDVPSTRWMESPEGTGILSGWSAQGVLLLNATLTVSAGRPGSHQGLGWEALLEAVIETILLRPQPVVFLLLGKHASAWTSRIHAKQHLVIEAPHPSPLSAYRGFFGSRPFSRTNRWLASHGAQEVDWWRGIPSG